MDAILMLPSSSIDICFSTRPTGQPPPCRRQRTCSSSACWCSIPYRRETKQKRSFGLYADVRSGGGKRLVVVEAKKTKKGNDSDEHSFAPKMDESTGPFPEGVLLKKRTVKEDGRTVPEFADAEEEELFEFLNLQLESDLNVERVRHYEVVYLIHEDRTDEVESVVSKVQDFIGEKKGRIWRLNNWGLRRLAYKIKKASKATYILMNFEMEASCINDFKTMLDKDERIIRHLVIKRDEAITEDCPPPLEFHSLKSHEIDDDEDGYDNEDDEILSDSEDENIIIIDDDDEVDIPSTGGERLMAEKRAR